MYKKSNYILKCNDKDCKEQFNSNSTFIVKQANLIHCKNKLMNNIYCENCGAENDYKKTLLKFRDNTRDNTFHVLRGSVSNRFLTKKEVVEAYGGIKLDCFNFNELKARFPKIEMKSYDDFIIV